MDDDPIIMLSADYQLSPKWGCARLPIAYEDGIFDATKGLLTSNPMNQTWSYYPLLEIDAEA
jgi:hypothetical protein